jgi:hypothetical protein
MTRCRIFCLSLSSALVLLSSSFAHAQWTAPIPEELSMTSQPQVPGAAAVYLYREETTDDKMHMFSIYTRLKVLTEGGKEYANVELDFARGQGGFTVDNIEGRTIHPDGTIIPFTGKPYEKLIEKTQGLKVMEKVFTLPDVEVGSIIEYRYKLRYNDDVLQVPQWIIQSKLWMRKGYYSWKPIDLSGNIIVTGAHGNTSNVIAWTPVLPPGTQVVQSHIPGTERMFIELNVHDIPPAPEESFMPPIGSFTYRVLFYYASYDSLDDFWKNEGKYWSKAQDKFIGPGRVVTAAVKDLTAPTDTPDQKLRKLYAAVMKLENTSFTRERSSAEEKAEGFKEVNSTDDIWTRKRGNNDQLAELFVAMARAAGMKAYVAAVTNRDRTLFTKVYLNLSQLDDIIAIVNVVGKEEYFDPGSRYCPYQHLVWKHTFTEGIRQTAGGTDFARTPGEPYTYSQTLRVADLAIDQQGVLTGKIKMTYMGDPGVRWRQRSLEGDATSLERELRDNVEHLMPGGVEVKVASIDKLDDYEQPLVVNLEVKGTLGSSTGKRVLLPPDIFEANSKPTFTQKERNIPVYFEYPRMVLDAMRIKFPSTFALESLPAGDKTLFEKAISYSMTTEATPTSFTVHRSYILGEFVFPSTQYTGLRTFYSKMENKDQETVVLTTVPTKAAPAGN